MSSIVRPFPHRRPAAILIFLLVAVAVGLVLLTSQSSFEVPGPTAPPAAPAAGPADPGCVRLRGPC
jgi:hypothetical protein